MGGGHHEPLPEVPHYSTYKVEDIRQLRENKAKLAKLGLKDPWARNEAWRFIEFNKWGRWKLFWTVAGRGFKTGMALGALTAVAGYYMDDGHGHGHGDGHGDGHGEGSGH